MTAVGYLVAFDFDPQGEGELQVSKGEIVLPDDTSKYSQEQQQQIVEMHESGWIRVETLDDTPAAGYVPGSFLEEHPISVIHELLHGGEQKGDAGYAAPGEVIQMLNDASGDPAGIVSKGVPKDVSNGCYVLLLFVVITPVVGFGL